MNEVPVAFVEIEFASTEEQEFFPGLGTVSHLSDKLIDGGGTEGDMPEIRVIDKHVN